MLYIVATPIGNLKDITLRALEILKSVDLIACEDTRHTKILLDHYQIATPTTSFFQHNRVVKAGYLINLLKEGKSIALVSDAGTPGILDPGYNLINAAISQKIEVTVIPGPTALIDALVLSGKPAHSFIFEGFFSNKKTARKNRLKKLRDFKGTVIFYESCHRIIDTIKDIEEIYGEHEIVVCRELTKKFEEVKRGKPSQILQSLQGSKPRGEFVVLI